jgi:uncharacterized SAM-binding protein YcdF (DUF218 family)
MYLSLAFYIGVIAESDTKKKSDAILVLGARSYIGGTYNPCLKTRVDHAAALYKEGYAPKIIVSGGNDHEDNANEAETMRKIAMEQGVPKQDILLEKAASSTYENIRLSQPIMKSNKLRSVILVTEPFHIARASLVTQKQGVQHSISPAMKSPCWQPNKYLSKYFLKEPVAVIMYKLQNKL